MAPDYLYCEASVKDRLVQAIGKEIRAQFGERPLDNENYGKIINQKHFRRLAGLIDREKVVFGGGLEEGRCRIEPTVMDNVTWEDPVMGEEIFGPILPVLTFQTLEEAAAQVNSRPHPLALYLFTSDKQHVRYVTSRASSAAAASTTPSSTWPPAQWASAAWGPAAWGLPREGGL